MPERIIKNLLNTQQRQAFLIRLPIFRKLSEEKSISLVSLMYERYYQSGEVIVTEDALIDNIYIITKGRAEVTRKIIKKNKITKKIKIVTVPVAVIVAGDSIGLNDTGFFSPSGKRVATVTAISDVQVLVLNIKELHHFLYQHEELESTLYSESAQILKIRLIKQVLPFSDLSHDRLQWLASKVEKLSVSDSHTIFKQGEIGDRCYLIRSGQIEIFYSQDGRETHLTTLKAPTIFGEATIVIDSVRNVSARALENCELLALRYVYLTELFESERHVANMFMTLMVERNCPQKNSSVTAHHRMTPDKQPIVILKNPATNHYFKLSPEGWYIWQQLNGKNRVQHITLALKEKYNIFSPKVVVGLISKLAKDGFVNNLTIDEEISGNHSWLSRLRLKMGKILKLSVVKNPDSLLTSIYNNFHFLFTKMGFICFGILSLAGVISFFLTSHAVITIFETQPNVGFIIFLLIPFSLIAVILHEFGHAIAMKFYGYKVHYMGVGWHWLRPVSFTDTSESWLGSRKSRMVVNMAGIALDLLTAGILSLLIWIIPNPYMQCFLWLCMFYIYFRVLRRSNPLREDEGYYALEDFLNGKQLRDSAINWLILRKDSPTVSSHCSKVKDYFADICYWVICILYLIVIGFITWWLLGLIFMSMDVQSEAWVLNLILPFVVVIMSSWNMILEIRKKIKSSSG